MSAVTAIRSETEEIKFQIPVQLSDDIQSEIDAITYSCFAMKAVLNYIANHDGRCPVSGVLLRTLYGCCDGFADNARALSYAIGVEPDAVLRS